VADREERDSRSIFISNIDKNTTEEDLLEHFEPCGKIVSIVITKVKGSDIKRKVFLEFEDISSVDNGLLLNDSVLHGRTLRVLPKRTNIRNFTRVPRPQVTPQQWTQWPNQQWQTQWPSNHWSQYNPSHYVQPNFHPQNWQPQWQSQQQIQHLYWMNQNRK
jgi:RNA recognition motif-containing protein